MYPEFVITHCILEQTYLPAGHTQCGTRVQLNTEMFFSGIGLSVT